MLLWPIIYKYKYKYKISTGDYAGDIYYVTKFYSVRISCFISAHVRFCTSICLLGYFFKNLVLQIVHTQDARTVPYTTSAGNSVYVDRSRAIQRLSCKVDRQIGIRYMGKWEKLLVQNG